jgi:hypothetical protein
MTQQQQQQQQQQLVEFELQGARQLLLPGARRQLQGEKVQQQQEHSRGRGQVQVLVLAAVQQPCRQSCCSCCLK